MEPLLTLRAAGMTSPTRPGWIWSALLLSLCTPVAFFLCLGALGLLHSIGIASEAPGWPWPIVDVRSAAADAGGLPLIALLAAGAMRGLVRLRGQGQDLRLAPALAGTALAGVQVALGLAGSTLPAWLAVPVVVAATAAVRFAVADEAVSWRPQRPAAVAWIVVIGACVIAMLAYTPPGS